MSLFYHRLIFRQYVLDGAVVLSITDQFGMIDALILLLNLFLLGLLFVTRQRIAQAEG